MAGSWRLARQPLRGRRRWQAERKGLEDIAQPLTAEEAADARRGELQTAH
jgi:hypothetical protein